MTVSVVLLGVALVCALWGVVSAIVIVDALQKRGARINWPLIRLFLPRYARQYRDATRTETGRVGPWYYSFLGAMNLALVIVAIALILRVR